MSGSAAPYIEVRSVFSILLIFLLLVAGSHHSVVASPADGTASTAAATGTSSSASKGDADSVVVSTAAASRRPSVSSISDQTCESRAVNYITHHLPKQCLAQSSVASAPPSSSFSDPSSITLTTSHTISTSGSTTPTSSADIPAGAILSISSTSIILENESTEEADSPLDNAKFLSFEEWKNANLAQAGQSAETLGRQGRAAAVQGQTRHRPAGTNNGLDSLGEDSEIELDFSGFGPGSDPVASSGQQAKHDENRRGPGYSSESAIQSAAAAAPYLRSKDAGVTCKERFNYASFDCAANVLKTNPKCKNPSSILVENKDSYMLNECSVENKFLIVELCDDILIDTIVLANFEFFSSIFRTFRVSVSDRYPVRIEKWKELGLFEARNTREIQAFLVENPLIWARYLRIEFLSHYGSEFYCPLSLLRIHGTTMMEEFRHQEALARGEIDPEEEETPVVIDGAGDEQIEKAIVPAPVAKSQEDKDGRTDLIETINLPSPTDLVSSSSLLNISASTAGATTPSTITTTGSTDTQQTCPASEKMLVTTAQLNITGRASVPNNTQSEQQVCALDESPVTHASQAPTSIVTTRSHASMPANSAQPRTTVPTPVADPRHETTSPDSNASRSSKSVSKANSNATTSTTTSVRISNAVRGSSSAAWTKHHHSSSSNTISPPPSPSSSHTSVIKTSVLVATSVSSPYSYASPHVHSSPPAQVSAAAPATQESFFKSIHKRLQVLESNATLSLQYIEAQSQLLRDAFGKVERRQLNKTSQFLETLNQTVLSELARFKGEYEQLWQSTVLELASQREEGRRERELLGERVRLLAEEMVGQKRLMAAQATLLLLCLGLVVFGRFGVISPSTSSSSMSDGGFVAGMQDIIRRSRSTGGVAARRSNGNAFGGAGSISSNKLSSLWPIDMSVNGVNDSSPWTSPSHSPYITRPPTAHGRSLSRETTGELTTSLRKVTQFEEDGDDDDHGAAEFDTVHYGEDEESGALDKIQSNRQNDQQPEQNAGDNGRKISSNEVGREFLHQREPSSVSTSSLISQTVSNEATSPAPAAAEATTSAGITDDGGDSGGKSISISISNSGGNGGSGGSVTTGLISGHDSNRSASASGSGNGQRRRKRQYNKRRTLQGQSHSRDQSLSLPSTPLSGGSLDGCDGFPMD